ncbi:hypothetical protein [Luteimonas fraxinea]|uniref:Uncharacterized protein n=1 Tax=Luteimonas fraxinea TaxID=2901869 RepID=A0ABS8UC36_9GAMM|nr:hypothetical protein [Luteimonas fraxinea]MCD9096213.1 hypothetical protein [Luteimonas fraxinea]
MDQTNRAELAALVDDLLHAVLGAPEDELQQPFDEGCRALADLPLAADDRVWVDAELERIGVHFDLI